jgi:hypothetical protein
MKMKKIITILLAIALPSLLLTGIADAAPKAPNSSLEKVSGSVYGDEIGIAWSFDGKAGQYPRLHVELLCWYDSTAAANIDFNAKFAYGNTVYLDGASVETLYPGSGVAYFWTGPTGGIAPWTSEPASTYYCRARLLDWTTQGIRNQYPRFWQTTPVFEIQDLRVP